VEPAPPREAAPKPPRAGARALNDITPEELLAALERHDHRAVDAARALGISKTGLYSLMHRVGVPTSADLSRETILDALSRCGGDLGRVARCLKVSPRALALRMRSLGLDVD
jgi:DNA-binding NtrC family response regulator